MPTLVDVATSLNLPFRGDAGLVLERIAPLESASASDLSFVAQKKFIGTLNDTDAGAVLLPEAWAESYSGPVIFSDDPYADFARATHLFDNRPQASRQVHETAVVAESARLGDGVTIDAGAVIEDDVVLANGVWVGAGAYIGHGAAIGERSELRPGVRLYHNTLLGSDVLIHANTVIGSDGFGFAPVASGWEKILQLGRVVVGDRVEIGANCAIDRGALDDTIVEDDVIIDNLVHIAHGVRIGRQSAVAGQVGFAGGAELGERCTVGGQAGFAGHLTVANDVHIGGQGRVARGVDKPGHYASGTSLMPARDWAKNSARYEKLYELVRRVERLEKQQPSGTDEAKDK